MNNMKKFFYLGGAAGVALLATVIALLSRSNLEFDMSGISFEDKVVSYEKGVSHSLEIDGELPEDVKVTYAYNGNYDAVGASTVNVHTVTATFTHNNSRYDKIEDMTATLVITTEHVITYLYNDNEVNYQTVRFYDTFAFPTLGELTNVPANEEFVWVDEDLNVFNANDLYTYPHDKSIELTAVYVYNSEVIEYEFNENAKTATLYKYFEKGSYNNDGIYTYTNAYVPNALNTVDENSEDEEVATPYIYSVSPQVLKYNSKNEPVIYDVTALSENVEEHKFSERDAFADCLSFDQVILPESILVLGTSVFSGCKNITSINIPNNVTIIGRHAFENCWSLESVVLPAFVDEVREDGEYILSEGLKEILDGAFYNCEKLTYVYITDRVTVIGDDAFDDCDNLLYVFIPSSVVTVGEHAFRKNSGTAVTLYVEAGTVTTGWDSTHGATVSPNKTLEEFTALLIEKELIPNPEADLEEEEN